MTLVIAKSGFIPVVRGEPADAARLHQLGKQFKSSFVSFVSFVHSSVLRQRQSNPYETEMLRKKKKKSSRPYEDKVNNVVDFGFCF